MYICRDEWLGSWWKVNTTHAGQDSVISLSNWIINYLWGLSHRRRRLLPSHSIRSSRSRILRNLPTYVLLGTRRRYLYQSSYMYEAKYVCTYIGKLLHGTPHCYGPASAKGKCVTIMYVDGMGTLPCKLQYETRVYETLFGADEELECLCNCTSQGWSQVT